MTTITMPSSLALVPSLEAAWQAVDSSFERFCLSAGIGAIERMLCEDAKQLAGALIAVVEAVSATVGAGLKERSGSMAARLPCIARGCAVSTAMKLRCRPGLRRKPRTSWPLGHEPDADQRRRASSGGLYGFLRAICRSSPGTAPRSRQPRAGSSRYPPSGWLNGWRLTYEKLDLLVVQIDGLHIGNDLVLVGALGIDANGHKHPLGLVEGATENTAVVQALIDNLIARGLDPTVCRLFIIDGAKALSKVIGPHLRCQRADPAVPDSQSPQRGRAAAKPLHASVRRALRQAWELDDANKAERLLRNLARRLDQEAPRRCSQHPRRARRNADRRPPSDCRQSSGARSPAPTRSRT